MFKLELARYIKSTKDVVLFWRVAILFEQDMLVVDTKNNIPFYKTIDWNRFSYSGDHFCKMDFWTGLALILLGVSSSSGETKFTS